MSLPEAVRPLSATSAGNKKAEVFSFLALVKEMDAIAKRIRRYIISMIGKAGSGHSGSSLSGGGKNLGSLYLKVL